MNPGNIFQPRMDADGRRWAGTTSGAFREVNAVPGTPSVFIRVHPWFPASPAILTRGSR